MPRATRLSLEVMETLVTLVECEGDASAAADLLEINQPSMSKRMAQLQQRNPDSHLSWLHRVGKKWHLTDEGQRVLPAIREIVRLARQLQADSQLRKEDAPDLSVACGQFAARTFVRDALLNFRRAYPEARIRLSTSRGAQRIEGVETGLFDLAIVSHDEAAIRDLTGHRLVIEHLLDDPWMLVCGSKVPAAVARAFDALPDAKVNLQHLQELPLILPEADSGARQKIDKAILRSGKPVLLHTTIETGGWGNILQFVQDGLGVGLISNRALAGATRIRPPKAIDQKLIEPPKLKIVYRSEEGPAKSGELAEKFRQYLHDACRV